MGGAARFTETTVDDLVIEDESSFRHVALYADLKEVLRKTDYRFRILPDAPVAQWDRALLLNLTFWSADQGGDVLVDRTLAADVVAHAAWHRLAAKALGSSAASLFLGESIASAFDLYLVGRLLGHTPESSFLETQVSAMAEVAEASGVDEDEFEALLASVAADPERAFADLRALLFEATTKLHACDDAESALAALTALEGHRFASLIPHYALSTWVLYARAYAREKSDPRTEDVVRALHAAADPLAWLTTTWILG
jgi:hypothetical protein